MMKYILAPFIGLAVMAAFAAVTSVMVWQAVTYPYVFLGVVVLVLCYVIGRRLWET